jgi:hypothetical protein
VSKRGELVRHGDQYPVDVQGGGETRHHDIESLLGHVQRYAHGVIFALFESAG